MVFASAVFLFAFFPLFYCIYYLLGKCKRIQNVWILIGSLLFYSWGGVWALLVLAFTIVVNFYLGILIENNIGGGRAKVFLGIAIVYNLSNLIFFKYFNFLFDNLLGALDIIEIHVPWESLNIPLPIGISFYTFQVISYIVDVYRQNVKAQRNIINLGIYVALFPQLIAGPIVRYIDVEKEIVERKYEIKSVGEGLERFIYGLSKKLLIADVIGKVADYSFDNMAYGNTFIAWLGIIAYAFQIYYDFSAYSDMAIGMGRMMGFRFLENFNYPYMALSVREFWRRWHISLSTWFRDYLYIPLGGNRTGKTYRNLLLVFLLTGLWHGASWNFIVWGLWHGLFLILERQWKNLDKVPKIVRWFYTILCVEIGWVFFRAKNLREALGYLQTMFSFSGENMAYVGLIIDLQVIVTFVFAVILSYPVIQKLKNNHIFAKINVVCTKGQIILDIICYVLCMLFVLGTKSNPFIYFKF